MNRTYCSCVTLPELFGSLLNRRSTPLSCPMSRRGVNVHCLLSYQRASVMTDSLIFLPLCGTYGKPGMSCVSAALSSVLQAHYKMAAHIKTTKMEMIDDLQPKHGRPMPIDSLACNRNSSSLSFAGKGKKASNGMRLISPLKNHSAQCCCQL